MSHDEPLSALDAHLRVRMQTELARLHRQLKITFIYVTHAQSEAFALADRVVVMSEGEIQQEGRPQVVYREPANAFVANFIGMNNLVRGEMAGLANGFIEVRNDIATFRVPANRPVAVGEHVAFVIAADWISIVSRGDAPGHGAAVVGTVLGLEFVGSTQTVFVEVPDLSELRVQKQQHEVEALRIVPGRDVSLSWDPGRTWLLPAEN